MDEVFALGREAAAALIARGWTIAIAESSTGGLISAAILAVPGASACYRGGGVIYTAAAREALLGMTPPPGGWRPATEDYATLLAETARLRLGADWGLGESGAAGPDGNRYGDPAGHSCFAVKGPGHLARTLETGSGDRLGNMQAFACAGLRLIVEACAAGR